MDDVNNDDSKMKVTLSKGIWKYTLLFLDCVIGMIAVAVMSFGVVALGVAGSMEGAYTIAALGSFIMGISFWGLFASVRESYWLCISYIVLSILGFISIFVVMIALLVMKDMFIDSTHTRIENAFSSNAVEMNIIQSQYNCCGKDGKEDYLVDDADIFNATDITDLLPKSCCKLEICDDTASVFTKGCTMAALDIFENQTDYFMLSILLTVIFKVFGVVAAFYFAKILKSPGVKTDQKPLTE